MKRVTFKQAAPGINRFVSTDGEGYELSRNEDRKTWTATHNGTTLSDKLGSRGEAETQVQEHHVKHNKEARATTTSDKAAGKKVARKAVTTDAPAQDAADDSASDTEAAPKKEKPLVTANEHKLMTQIRESETPKAADEVMEEFGDRFMAMGIITTLGKKKYLDFEGKTLTLSEEGEKAYATYVPKEKKQKAKKERDPNAPRKNPMEARYGPRPEGIGPSPTKLEYEEARLANAQASYDFSIVHQRMHPYSPKAAAKVTSAQERLNIIQARVDELKASPAGQEVATDATPDQDSASAE